MSKQVTIIVLSDFGCLRIIESNNLVDPSSPSFLPLSVSVLGNFCLKSGNPRSWSNLHSDRVELVKVGELTNRTPTGVLGTFMYISKSG